MDASVQSSNRKLCRACLRQYESRKDLISLQSFDQNSPSSAKIRFHDMLSNVMHQTLPESDALPSKICIMCLSSLRVSYYFRLEVEKSQETLAKKLKSSNIRVTVKEEIPGVNFPVILRPRHVEKDAFHASTINDEVLMDTDDEIIDYEPDLDSVMDYNEPNSPSKTSDIHNESVRSTDGSKHNTSIDGSEKGNFDCSECQKSFNSNKAMQCHKRTIHSGLKCIYCQKKFPNKQQLKLHIRFKHREKYSEYIGESDKSANETENEGDKNPVVLVERLEKFNECSTCDLKFANKLALVKHHAECDSKCIDCGLKIPRKDFYFKHLETVHKYPCIDLAGYECPFCMNLFRTEKVLQEHIQRLHPDENQSNVDTISEAGESTSTDGITLHTCKICSQSFQSSKSLKQHTTIKHKDASRDNSINLASDKKLSSNVRKYTKDEFFEKFIVKKSNDFYRCIPCRKDVFKRSVMLHAKSKHAAIRCHRCELCSEAFFRTDYRLRHFAVSHPNDYKCLECDTQFDRAYKYEAHMTQHGRIQKILKPDEGRDRFDLSPHDIYYIEDSSTYDYTNDELLMNVSNTEQVESNEEVVPLSKDDFCDKFMVSVSDKNIKCNICNVEMQKNSVVSHLLWKHALKKPLKCSFCNDRVVKNNARLAHMARCHPNEYKCFECNQQFAKHHLYADHMNDFHEIRVATSPSAGEEDDINNNDMRFVSNRNDDEVIEEADNMLIEATTPVVEEKSYPCQFCPKKFTSSKNLLIHKSHKHKNEPAEMPVLDTTIDPMEPISFDEFKYNWVEFINENDLKCLVCEVVMRRKNFPAHVKYKHCVSGAYLCALCPESFHRPEQRIQHMSQNHRGIFYCNSCNIQFYRNSRYAKHMSDRHNIEIDSYDSYEVDLGLDELKFVPFVQKNLDDDQLSITSSTINEPDPIEGMMQLLSAPSEEMSRQDFVYRYIKFIGKDRHCLACDKVFYHSSIYHHLIHFHSTVLPFKCPFCDVRFERTVQRSKHLQMFHPDEYKCNECGLQFSKHIKYSEHMLSEHNTHITTQKSPLEVRDLSSLDIKYVAQKSMEENIWQEDEFNAIANSTAYSEYQDESRNEDSAHLNIKSDKPEAQTISYVEDDQLVEIPAPNNVAAPALEDELPYLEFKAKYLQNVDGASAKCLACNRIILKTSVCAHMRLWHSTAMIYNCELCPIGFRRGDYRMRHMTFQHPGSYKCSECSAQFYYSAIFKEHLWCEHKIKMNVPVLKHKDDIDVPLENLKFAPYVPEELRLHPDESGNRGAGNRRRNSLCIEVPTTSKGNAEDGYTYKEFHSRYVEARGETSKCKACGKIFSKLSIKKHIKRDHCTSKPYYCQLCDEGFLRTDDRVTHMRKVHPDSFKCLMCDVQFYLSTKYIDHMSNEHNMTLNIASNKSEYEVDIPFDRLRFKPQKANESSNHNQSSDGGLSRDDFTSKYLSRFHVDNELHLQCSACNKSFAAKQKRFHLIQNHAKVRPFGCELCEARFLSNFKRVKHMAIHHANDFKCQICNIQFEKSEIYAKHMQDEHKITIKVNSNIDVDINGEDMLYYEKVKKNPIPVKVTSNSIAEESENSSFNLLESLHCDVCNIDCDSSRSYRQHLRDHVGGIDSTAKNPEIKVEKNPEPIVSGQMFPCGMCDKQLSSIVARNVHKRFKHGVVKEKQTKPSQKFEVVCEICEFTTYRRDYIEHHMKQQHKGEFKCPYCKRALSSYNYYVYHVETNHFSKPNLSEFFKCSDCDNYFKIEENLQKHKSTYHGENPPKRNHFCKLCTMNFSAVTHLKNHLETYTHRNLVNFLNGTLPSTSKSVKDEPCEKSAIENHSDQNDDKKLEQNNEEPEAKRLKLSPEKMITESDKLEYIKYLQTTDSGHFKCGICGKVKSLRKHMLHHLKQHKEVPTFNCDKCPERFVFKTKYDKHMELHENGGMIPTMNETSSNAIQSNNDLIRESKEAVIEDEHPKFQEVKKNPPEIKCTICNVSFKLTIMLNKHNSTWHSDSNPFKELTMSDQKQKKSNESVPVIKFLRCEQCKDAFTKQEELENHIKTAHKKSSEETDTEDEDMDVELATKFSCERCPLKFHNIKFLENHQKFFCIHRNQPKVDNEQ